MYGPWTLGSQTEAEFGTPVVASSGQKNTTFIFDEKSANVVKPVWNSCPVAPRNPPFPV